MALIDSLAATSRRIHDGVRRRLFVKGGRRPVDVPDTSLAVPFGYRPDDAMPGPIAVVCHLFHDELAVEFRESFKHLPVGTDLFLSTDTAAKAERIRIAFAGWEGGVDVRIAPNQGRDIGPKLVTFADIYPRYALVLFVHGKRSMTSRIGDDWRRTLTSTLAGSPEVVRSILHAFARHPRLGIVLPQHFEPIRQQLRWDGNFLIARRLARRMGFRLHRRMVLELPAGSMFWARPAALRPLLDLQLSHADFPPERGQLRGTVQHAVERLFLFACEAAGFDWVKVADPHRYPATAHIEPVPSPSALDQLVAHPPLRLLPDGSATRYLRPASPCFLVGAPKPL